MVLELVPKLKKKIKISIINQFPKSIKRTKQKKSWCKKMLDRDRGISSMCAA